MDQQRLSQIELLSQQLFGGEANAEVRLQAEKLLTPFSVQPEYVPQCEFLLMNSGNPYTQLFATHALTKQLQANHKSLQPVHVNELTTGLFLFLETKGAQATHFVISGIAKVISKLTKLFWLTEPAPEKVLDKIAALMQRSPEHIIVGLIVSSVIVDEMNNISTDTHMIYSEHRKIAISFRDKILLDIFKLGMQCLTQIYGPNNAWPANLHDRLKDHALELSLKCLSFDFYGTVSEEEDLIGTVDLPSSWIPFFTDTLLSLFWTIFFRKEPIYSNKALKCITQLASVRRSLWEEEETRLQYLHSLMRSIGQVFKTKDGLFSAENHQEFCRLIAKLKGNHHMADMMGLEQFSDWMTSACMFTGESFAVWQWSPHSSYYLLIFWNRILIASSAVKGVFEMEPFILQVVQMFIKARLDLMRVLTTQGTVSDIFEDSSELLIEQQDTISSLGRCSYSQVCQTLISCLEGCAKSFTDNPSQSLENATAEVQLSWLIWTVGNVISGRTVSSPDSDEELDAQLSFRIIRLIGIYEVRLTQTEDRPGKSLMAIAVFEFLQHFRKNFLEDQTRMALATDTLLHEVGFPSKAALLEMVINKIYTSLKYWKNNEQLITRALSLLQDLCSSYTVGNKLIKLDQIGRILANHDPSQEFPCLDLPSNFKKRTTYYSALAQLLFRDVNATNFADFMRPFTQKMAYLFKAFSDNQPPQQSMGGLLSLFRDLRGIVFASKSSSPFQMFFEWCQAPISGTTTDVFAFMLQLLEKYFNNPTVTTAILKFFHELVFNKGARISFDSNSVSGILLFRALSQTLVVLVPKLLVLPSTPNVWAEKYKSLSVCLNTLTRGLTGGYCNFGVFELYRDPALADALSMAFRMILSVPIADMLAYPKLFKAFCGILETVCLNHITYLGNLDNSSFGHIINLAFLGIDQVEVNMSSQCCTIINRFATFHLSREQHAKSPRLAALLDEFTMVFTTQILPALWNKVLYDDCPNQWSISRPIFTLMLWNPQSFATLREQIIQRQLSDHQAEIRKEFEELFQEIKPSLESQYRDQFTRNLTTFLANVKKFVR